jgi:hypothetical protein
MSIAFKEGLKIPPPALNEIILASNHDVRQVGNTGYEIPDQIVLFIFFYSSPEMEEGVQTERLPLEQITTNRTSK